MDEINDLIGRATYEAYHKGGVQNGFTRGFSDWVGMSQTVRDIWISAGCAARNVCIPNVTISSPETLRPTGGLVCVGCGSHALSLSLNSQGRWLCPVCLSKESPPPDGSPAGTP